ncbi:hypothetical protein CMO91_03460 [Candidatus Woesearchaeota archaeon]|nr:hypothetical protein [Candidatus Woesearchaeota archaeon]
MGRIIPVTVETAYVTQDELQLGSLEWLFWHFDRGLGATLGPPVVRKIGRHSWIVDGHNTFAVASLFQQEKILAYVPKNEDDFMYAEDFPEIYYQGLRNRNRNIKRLSKVVEEGHEMQEMGLRTIECLRKKCSLMKSVDDARRHLYPPEIYSPDEYAAMDPPEFSSIF